ncbi:MAG TPA: hypothetical protein VIH48_01855 [Candidatus Bathyarchaeia archaeon]
MKTKNFAKYATLLFTAIILTMPTLVDARRNMMPYNAQINATGTMTLTAMTANQNTSVTISIETNFTALVPMNVPRGTYDDVDFHGAAVVYQGATIKFDGLLTVENINFWAKFAISKPADLDIEDGLYSAVGQLDIVISDFTPAPSQITWVMMKGAITSYGESKAYGRFTAQAKISQNNNWTMANGFFTVTPPPAITAVQNRTCSYYVVTLANATTVEINVDGNALYIEGEWNVYNRTCTVTAIDSTQLTITTSITQITKRAHGELTVTLQPAVFTLKIDGIETIGGTVDFFHYKFAHPTERGIPMGDFNKDRVINMVDITRMAMAYGRKLGAADFDFDLDLNADFEVNLIDLATLAKEFENEY